MEALVESISVPWAGFKKRFGKHYDADEDVKRKAWFERRVAELDARESGTRQPRLRPDAGERPRAGRARVPRAAAPAASPAVRAGARARADDGEQAHGRRAEARRFL